MKTPGRWVVLGLAVLAVLAPLKFGTPVVTPVTLPPQSGWEWVFFSWPNQLLPLLACGLVLWLTLDSSRLPGRVDGLFLLPGLFLLTQLVAAPSSICRQTTTDTLLHFMVCVVVFYAAAGAVRDRRTLVWVSGGMALAAGLVLLSALNQHFGGLEATRAYAAGENISPEMQLRLTSNRVFGTLVYPNALAGFLVVVFAPVLLWCWRGPVRRWLQWGLMLGSGGLMVFCLALTGSRGGFVAFAVMIVVGLLVVVRRVWWLLAALAVLAIVFGVAHQAGFIRHGLSSASARGDYWRGAVAIALDHPWLGTGPGTFGSIYPKYKTATTEEAQLVHNSYLEMWSDSGVAAAAVFAVLWLVALWDGFKLARHNPGDLALGAVLAALAGWIVHGLLDFDLYVPGVALPAFLLLGALQGLKPVPPGPVPRRPRLALGTMGVAVVVVVVWVEGRSLWAGFCNARTQALVSTDLPLAAQSAAEAIHWNPTNHRYWSIAGDLALQQGRASEAVEFYRVAVGNDPYRSAYHWRLAHALARVGGRETEAVEQLQIACGLNPMQERYRAERQALEENIRQPVRGLLNSRVLE